MCNTGIAVVIWNAAPFDTVYRSILPGKEHTLHTAFATKTAKQQGLRPAAFLCPS